MYRYEEQNVRCLDGIRCYSAAVPTFLKNRPQRFVSHCLQRIPPAAATPVTDIVSDGLGQFSVTSGDSDKTYVVVLQSPHNANLPSCSCYDWCRHHLPCKHMLAVVMKSSLSGGWDALPVAYRNHPLFTLDPAIVATTRVIDDSTNISQEGHQLNDDLQLTAMTHHADATSSVTDSANVLQMQEDQHLPDALQPTAMTHHVDAANVMAHTEPPIEQSVARECSAADVDAGALSVNVEHCRSRIRQVLAGISSCTYVVDNVTFLQDALLSLREQLTAFKLQTQQAKQRIQFRRNRRLVKGSIAMTGLRRRLQIIRTKRQLRKVQSRNRSMNVGGDIEGSIEQVHESDFIVFHHFYPFKSSLVCCCYSMPLFVIIAFVC